MQLHRALLSWFKTDRQPMNHYEFWACATVLKLVFIVSIGVRFAVFPAPNEQMFWIVLVVYLTATIWHITKVYRNALIVLDNNFHYKQVFIDMLVIFSWTVSSGSLVTVITLYFLLPFLILVRLHVKGWIRMIICFGFFIGIPITDWLVFGWYDHTTSKFANDLIIYIGYMFLIVFVAHSAARNWFRNNRIVLDRNLYFAIEYIRSKTEAALGFIRVVHSREKGDLLKYTAYSSDKCLRKGLISQFINVDKVPESLVAEAYRHNALIQVSSKEDVRKKINVTELVEEYDLHSAVAIPIGYKAVNPFGTLSLYWSQVNIFADASTLHLYAKVLVDYLANQPELKMSHTEEELIRRIEKDRALNDGIGKMLNNTDFDQTANIIVNAAAEITDFELAFILFYDRESKQLVWRPDIGNYGIKLKYQNILQHVKLTEPTTKFDSLSQFEATRRFPEVEQFQHFLQCYGYPLTINEGQDIEQIGVLFIADTRSGTRSPSFFTNQRLLILASHGAVDLRNCQLLAMRQQANRVLERLPKATELLFNQVEKVDLKDLFKTVVQVANEFVQASFCTIMLVNADGKAIKNTFVSSDIRIQVKSKAESTVHPSPVVKELLCSDDNIRYINYEESKYDIPFFVKKHGILAAYIVKICLNEGQTAILYVNYRDSRPRYELDGLLLPLLQEQIEEAHKSWLLRKEQWVRDQRRQREMWRFDIHDQLNELQFKIQLPLEQLASRLHQNHNELSLVKDIQKHSMSIGRTLKQTMQDMADPVIVEQGLIAALQSLAANDSRIKLEITGEKEPRPQVINSLYRIVREAVQNAIKYGESPIIILLRVSKTEAWLTIRDNGRGFRQKLLLSSKGENSASRSQATGSGIGLMRYQADIIGASLILRNHYETGGASVVCEWQLNKKGDKY
ncbi:MAG: ATP-binding protein [Chloroflexota bacterium]